MSVQVLHLGTAVPYLSGTRDQFRGRQFFHGLGLGGTGGRAQVNFACWPTTHFLPCRLVPNRPPGTDGGLWPRGLETSVLENSHHQRRLEKDLRSSEMSMKDTKCRICIKYTQLLGRRNAPWSLSFSLNAKERSWRLTAPQKCPPERQEHTEGRKDVHSCETQNVEREREPVEQYWTATRCALCQQLYLKVL